MEPIHVPGPPKEAFNKNRPMSDLIKAQITHLKHLEEKLPPSVRANLPQHAIASESDAACYIAPMTRWLRSQGTAANADGKATQPAKAPIPMPAVRSRKPLALAAAAGPVKSKSRASVASKTRPAKKTPGNKGASPPKGKR